MGRISSFLAGLFLIITLPLNTTKTQTPDILWEKTFGSRENERAVGAFATISGNIMVGATQQDTASYDYGGWILRLDSLGNILEEFHTGYPDLDETYFCMSEGPDNTFLLAGSGEREDKYLDIYATKLDPTGKPVYGGRYGTTNYYYNAYGATVLPNGQCVIVGGILNSGLNALIMSTFDNLGLIFGEVFDWGFSEEFYGVALTPDNYFLAVGKTNSFSESDFILLQNIDTLGVNQIRKIYGFGGDDQAGNWIEPSTGGGYIITGYTTREGILNNRYIYVVKVDEMFNEEWSRIYEPGIGKKIINHPEGGYILGGSLFEAGGCFYLMRLDINGDTLWTKKASVNLSYLNSFSVMPDGGYILAGVRSDGYKIDAHISRLSPETTSSIMANPESLPDRVTLSQNYPNPFNPATAIRFGIPAEARVKIDVIDILGRRVENIIDKIYPPGEHTIKWNGKNYPAGIYFYRLECLGRQTVKKMALLR